MCSSDLPLNDGERRAALAAGEALTGDDWLTAISTPPSIIDAQRRNLEALQSGISGTGYIGDHAAAQLAAGVALRDVTMDGPPRSPAPAKSRSVVVAIAALAIALAVWKGGKA